jgi:hypothetical protein
MKSINEDDLLQIVCEYKVDLAGTPSDMRVTVIENPTGSYTAYTNYSFWGPDQIDAYQNNNAQASPLDAAKHVLNSVLSFWKNEYALDQIAWVAMDDPEHRVVLGNGTTTTIEAVRQQRTKK